MSAPLMSMSLVVPVIGKTGIWLRKNGTKLISNLTSVWIKCLLPIAPKGHNFQSLIDFQSVQDRCPVTMPNSISIAINSEFIKICSYRSERARVLQGAKVIVARREVCGVLLPLTNCFNHSHIWRPFLSSNKQSEP